MAGKNSDRPMAAVGARSKPKLLKVAQSTPSNRQQGVVANTERVALAQYEVNTRSFHPNKQFEPQGFRFHGDDRGFSLGKSWAEGDKTKSNVTSRVWQRFKLNMALEIAGDLSQDKASNLQVASNMSMGGPGLWSLFGHKEDYKETALQPRSTLKAKYVSEPHAGQKEIILTSWYGGINHAFGLIKSETITSNVVPVLDVNSVLFVKIERIQLYMDIAYLISGDGFPNCEAFIEDPAGNQLFIGRHIRIGTPDTHLWNNNTRLMCAWAVRVELDTQGNFKDRVWVFTQAFGGPPALRDQYPISAASERHQSGSKPAFYSNPFNDSPSRFTWDIGKIESMTQHEGGKPPAKQPLHLSAFVDISKVGTQLGKAWQAGPIKKTTRTDWNNIQLHQNPNEGRAADSYDLDASKWQ